MLHDPEAGVAANAVEDDPRTAAEETTDAKAAGTETIEAAVNKVATETTEVNEAATEETVAIDVPLTVVSVAMAATGVPRRRPKSGGNGQRTGRSPQRRGPSTEASVAPREALRSATTAPRFQSTSFV